MPASKPPVPTPIPRIRIVCGECRSENVSRDAWSEWDLESQSWILRCVFDDAYCHDCDKEMSLDEVFL